LGVRICPTSARAPGSPPRSNKVTNHSHSDPESILELGYTLNYPYLDLEDERVLRGRTEMEREMIIDERKEKAAAAQYKFKKLQEDLLKQRQDT